MEIAQFKDIPADKTNKKAKEYLDNIDKFRNPEQNRIDKAVQKGYDMPV